MALRLALVMQAYKHVEDWVVQSRPTVKLIGHGDFVVVIDLDLEAETSGGNTKMGTAEAVLVQNVQACSGRKEAGKSGE